MDETGSSIGCIKATRVIVDKTFRSRYSAQPGRQEWVSVIECVCMDGTALLPMIIFKGKTLSSAWLSENTPGNWFFSINNEGWTSNEHMKKWLKENFEPYTRVKANGAPRLLILMVMEVIPPLILYAIVFSITFILLYFLLILRTSHNLWISEFSASLKHI